MNYHAAILTTNTRWTAGLINDLHGNLLPGAFGIALAGNGGHRLYCALEDGGFVIHPTIFLWAGRNLETILLFQKSYKRRPTESIIATGAGTLNIDACRVAYEQGGNLASNPSLRTHINGGNGGYVIANEKDRRVVIPNPGGRWPSNLLLAHLPACEGVCVDGCAVGIMDAVRTSTTGNRRIKQRVQEKLGVTTFTHGKNAPEYTDSGGAARYFPRLAWTEEDASIPESDHPVSLYRWLASLLLPPAEYTPRRLLASGSTPALRRGVALAGWEEIVDLN